MTFEPVPKTAEQMIEELIFTYRDAARGWIDVHIFLLDGKPHKEIFVEGTSFFSPERIQAECAGFDANGQPVELTYAGVMPAETCDKQADELELQLAAQQP